MFVCSFVFFLLFKTDTYYGVSLGVGVGGRGEVLPYMGYIGMCRCEGYGFQAVYSRIVR